MSISLIDCLGNTQKKELAQRRKNIVIKCVHFNVIFECSSLNRCGNVLAARSAYNPIICIHLAKSRFVQNGFDFK
jgi:hypothetical protein